MRQRNISTERVDKIAIASVAVIELSGTSVQPMRAFGAFTASKEGMSMRFIRSRYSTGLVNVALALTLFAIVPAKAISEESLQARNDAYLNEVISILRSHVLSMRMILDHDDLRYADNMVRHAEAFERAFGMIGPMEWHAAEAFKFAQKTGASEKFSQAQFEELAEKSNAAIRKIKRSATRYGRDKNKDLMRGSINEMIKSCGGCHARLPKGSVPSVWKGIKE